MSGQASLARPLKVALNVRDNQKEIEREGMGKSSEPRVGARAEMMELEES
jgi:hypothetical protein